MNTKKLVLGFCVLAAVTGSAPHVFGGESLQDRLAEAIPDNRIRAECETALASTEQQFQAKVDDLASMGDEEVRLVRDAILKDRRAHLLDEIMISDFSKINAINEEIRCIHSDLCKADYPLFFSQKQAKVDMLKSKLKETKQQRILMREQIVGHSRLVTEIGCEARQAMKEACLLHAQRVARLNELCDTTISEREGSLSADLDGFRDLGKCSISDQVQMYRRALGDLVVIRAAELIRRDVRRVDRGLWHAVWETQDDYAWFHGVTGLDRSLYNTWQTSFCSLAIDYDSDTKELVAPLDRLRNALFLSNGVENVVRQSLKAHYQQMVGS
jgi:hypothetical protein